MRKNVRKHQSGLTIIELMVAVLLSLVLTAGVIQVFMGSKQTYRMQDAVSRIQESGRFGIQFLTRQIRQTDFWGCGGGTNYTFTNNLNDSNAGYTAFHDPLDATEGGGTNPDSITIRNATTTGISVTGHNITSAVVTVSDNSQFSDGDIVAICDASQGDIFQITHVHESGGSEKINHVTGNAGVVPGNKGSGCPSRNGNSPNCFSKEYGSDAEVVRMTETIFTVANVVDGGGAAITNEFGDTIPALFQNGEELVRDVENMQLLYGVDTNGDGSADYYEDATTVGAANMDDVVAVRVALLVRSDKPVLPNATNRTYQLLDAAVTTNDRYLRSVFETTIALRNRLP